MSVNGDEWLESPTVYSDDPTTAYSEDGTEWLVAAGGGPHCAYRGNEYPFGYGCPLSPAHNGKHLPMADELLTKGFRLSPTPAPRLQEKPQP